MSNGIKLLVTGASGNLGGALAKALAKKGFKVRAIGRRMEHIPASPGVEVASMSYEDHSSVDEALKGVDGVFLIAPPLDPDAPAKLKPVVDRAKAIGLSHIVFNSAFGVDQAEEAPLRIIEKHLMASGLNYTILRPNFFMENFSTGFLSPMIAGGGIFLAADDAQTSFISVEDIAEVAGVAFQDKLWGQAFNLTGPAGLNHTEAARIISEVSGHNIAYHAISEEAMLNGAREAEMPEGAVQYMAVLYSAVRNGWMAALTDDVREVTGRAPISFQEFAKQNAAHFR